MITAWRHVINPPNSVDTPSLVAAVPGYAACSPHWSMPIDSSFWDKHHALTYLVIIVYQFVLVLLCLALRLNCGNLFPAIFFR
jgi:hypothetical protein